MKKIKLYSLILLLFFSCDKGRHYSNTESVLKKNSVEKKSDSVTVDLPNLTNNELYSDKEQKIDSSLFKFENEIITQTISIDFLSKDSLQFYLVSTNKMKNEKSTLSGIAILKNGSEFDEDENGLGYLAEEYLYENTCWLAIRIAIDDKNKIIIHEANCEEVRSESCPFESAGIMRIN
jgi:hypothetical protein